MNAVTVSGPLGFVLFLLFVVCSLAAMASAALAQLDIYTENRNLKIVSNLISLTGYVYLSVVFARQLW